jgi:general secretion pathway protein G
MRNVGKKRRAGFTLMELMIVITIIMILLSLAAGNYQRSILRSKEGVLKQNLYVMRQAIDQYTLDKQEAPQSIEDLVSAGYLRSVPMDPIANRPEWNLEFGDYVLSPDQTNTGITNVRSTSSGVSPFEGTSYSSW